MALVIGFQLSLLAVCGYALWRGGAPERIASVACLLAAAATIIVNIPRGNSLRHFEPETLVIDLLLLGVLAALAMKANRYWPLWATAAHSIAVAMHLVKAAHPALAWPLYGFVSRGSAALVILILWLGALRHRRRLGRHGSDPSWRVS